MRIERRFRHRDGLSCRTKLPWCHHIRAGWPMPCADAVKVKKGSRAAFAALSNVALRGPIVPGTSSRRTIHPIDPHVAVCRE